MNAFAGTGGLLRLALRRDRFVLGGLGRRPRGPVRRCSRWPSPTHCPRRPTSLRETRLMAGNAGFRMLSLSPGASVGAYTMSRGWVTLAVLAARDEHPLRGAPHAPERGDRTRRAARRRRGRAGSRRWPRPSPWRSARTSCSRRWPRSALIAAGKPAAGSLAAGAALAVVGVAFTGVAAVTAQLSRSARGASGLALAALAVSVLVSGVGNMLGHVDATGTVAHSAWPGWLTPVGWGYQLRPFGDEQWWVLGLVAACTPVLLARRRPPRGAARPRRRRAARAGRPASTPRPLLRRPVGHRPGVAAAAPGVPRLARGLVGFGLIFGSVSESAGESFSEGAGAYRRWGRRCSTPGSAPSSSMGGIAAAIYVVQVLLRMRDEEARGRLEPVLAGAVSRPRWMLAHIGERGARRRRAPAGLRGGGRADGRAGDRRPRPGRRAARRGAGRAAGGAGRGRSGGRGRRARPAAGRARLVAAAGRGRAPQPAVPARACRSGCWTPRRSLTSRRRRWRSAATRSSPCSPSPPDCWRPDSRPSAAATCAAG